jgi:hypothetical protein
MTRQEIQAQLDKAIRAAENLHASGCNEMLVARMLDKVEHWTQQLDAANKLAQYTQPSMLADSEGSPLFSMGA